MDNITPVTVAMFVSLLEPSVENITIVDGSVTNVLYGDINKVKNADANFFKEIPEDLLNRTIQNIVTDSYGNFALNVGEKWKMNVL